MQTDHINPFQQRRRMTLFYVAFICIAAGVLQLGHNAGWINDYWYYILFSWPMLLVVFGFGSFLQWKIGQGIALWATAAFFLMPLILGETSVNYWASWPEYIWKYWPVFLILGGLGMLLDMVFMPRQKRWHARAEAGNLRDDDGYVQGIASFYSLRHTVTAPVFRGARLEVSFGSLVFDLRHTSLEATETYIDLSNSFGGVELYVPSNWNVVNDVRVSFGAVTEKRFMTNEIDHSHKLVIRGNTSFGGVEIKN